MGRPAWRGPAGTQPRVAGPPGSLGQPGAGPRVAGIFPASIWEQKHLHFSVLMFRSAFYALGTWAGMGSGGLDGSRHAESAVLRPCQPARHVGPVVQARVCGKATGSGRKGGDRAGGRVSGTPVSFEQGPLVLVCEGPERRCVTPCGPRGAPATQSSLSHTQSSLVRARGPSPVPALSSPLLSAPSLQ